jgi:galactokinase
MELPARVAKGCRSAAAGDLDRIAVLSAASHSSLRDAFRVSTPGLDLLVGILVEEVHSEPG